MEKTISVIVPVYNVEKYLRQCVQCIIEQTYEKLEIILVDDGSTDSCHKLCDDYALQDSRIRVVHKKNGGLSDARNVGIAVSSGEYIALIDSDDYISLDYIEYLYRLIIDSRADMSICQRWDVDESGNPLREGRRYEDAVINGNKKCMKEFFTNPAMDTVAWGKLYKKSLFNNVQYPFGKYHEDVFTTYLLIAQCSCIAIGKERKYFYRQRNSSISNRTFTQKHLDSVEGKLECRQFMIRHYPELVQYANADVVYAANQCALRMIKAGIIKKEYIRFLQEQYKHFESDFLKGKSKFLSKAFSAIAYINLAILVKICIKLKRG